MTFLADFRAKWTYKAVRSLKTRGIAGTILLSIGLCKSILVRQCVRCITLNPWNPWLQFLDRRYDRRFGVDTAGVDLSPLTESQSAHAYSPVRQSTFDSVISHLGIDHSRFNFVDFGCGKGKALLLAAEAPFRQVIGIEISPKLAQIAEENIRTYKEKRCLKFQVVCADAGQYTLPPGPAVIYLYDPFKLDVVQFVVENIRRSLVAEPREMYIVYLDPIWRTVLDSARFLVLQKQTRRYCIYKTSQ